MNDLRMPRIERPARADAAASPSPPLAKRERGQTNRGVFICWSGPRGQQLCGALGRLLGRVFPELDGCIFASPQIEKGARWFDEVIRQLERSHVGILCLTGESLHSPWLHFEAGALVKRVYRDAEGAGAERPQNRILTYLHGVSAASLSGPLAQYQSTLATRAESRALIETVATVLELPESQERRKRFDQSWPAFEARLAGIHAPVQELIPALEGWFKRKTFDEPVQQCTDQNWIGRYDGARQTHDRLSDRVEGVRAACPRYQVDLYERLLILVDGYAMDIRALLLRAEPFPLADGELQIPSGVLEACEGRRRRIKEVLSRMLDPLSVPHTEEAAAFWISDSFDHCKLLVHRREHSLLRGERSTEKIARRLLQNIWDLDRIYGYLLIEHCYCHGAGAPDALCRAAVMELERFRAKDKANRSLMPFHYALAALHAAVKAAAERQSALDAASIRALIEEATRLIEQSRPRSGDDPTWDRGGQVRRTLREIEALIAPMARLP